MCETGLVFRILVVLLKVVPSKWYLSASIFGEICGIFFEPTSIATDMLDGAIERYITIYLMGTQQAVQSEFMKKRKIILKMLVCFVTNHASRPGRRNPAI